MVNPKTIHGLELWNCPGFECRMTEAACLRNRDLVKPRRNRNPKSRRRGSVDLRKRGFKLDEIEARRQVCLGCPGVRGLAQGESRVEVESGPSLGFNCEVCGREEFRNHERPTQRTCSTFCATKLANSERQRRRQAQRVKAICVQCGTEYSRHPSNRGHHCSPSCTAKTVASIKAGRA